MQPEGMELLPLGGSSAGSAPQPLTSQQPRSGTVPLLLAPAWPYAPFEDKPATGFGTRGSGTVKRPRAPSGGHDALHSESPPHAGAEAHAHDPAALSPGIGGGVPLGPPSFWRLPTHEMDVAEPTFGADARARELMPPPGALLGPAAATLSPPQPLMFVRHAEAKGASALQDRALSSASGLGASIEDGDAFLRPSGASVLQPPEQEADDVLEERLATAVAQFLRVCSRATEAVPFTVSSSPFTTASGEAVLAALRTGVSSSVTVLRLLDAAAGFERSYPASTDDSCARACDAAVAAYLAGTNGTAPFTAVVLGLLDPSPVAARVLSALAGTVTDRPVKVVVSAVFPAHTSTLAVDPSFVVPGVVDANFVYLHLPFSDPAVGYVAVKGALRMLRPGGTLAMVYLFSQSASSSPALLAALSAGLIYASTLECVSRSPGSAACTFVLVATRASGPAEGMLSGSDLEENILGISPAGANPGAPDALPSCDLPLLEAARSFAARLRVAARHSRAVERLRYQLGARTAYAASFRYALGIAAGGILTLLHFPRAWDVGHRDRVEQIALAAGTTSPVVLAVVGLRSGGGVLRVALLDEVERERRWHAALSSSGLTGRALDEALLAALTGVTGVDYSAAEYAIGKPSHSPAVYRLFREMLAKLCTNGTLQLAKNGDKIGETIDAIIRIMQQAHRDGTAIVLMDTSFSLREAARVSKYASILLVWTIELIGTLAAKGSLAATAGSSRYASQLHSVQVLQLPRNVHALAAVLMREASILGAYLPPRYAGSSDALAKGLVFAAVKTSELQQLKACKEPWVWSEWFRSLLKGVKFANRRRLNLSVGADSGRAVAAVVTSLVSAFPFGAYAASDANARSALQTSMPGVPKEVFGALGLVVDAVLEMEGPDNIASCGPACLRLALHVLQEGETVILADGAAFITPTDVAGQVGFDYWSSFHGGVTACSALHRSLAPKGSDAGQQLDAFICSSISSGGALAAACDVLGAGGQSWRALSALGESGVLALIARLPGGLTHVGCALECVAAVPRVGFRVVASALVRANVVAVEKGKTVTLDIVAEVGRRYWARLPLGARAATQAALPRHVPPTGTAEEQLGVFIQGGGGPAVAAVFDEMSAKPIEAFASLTSEEREEVLFNSPPLPEPVVTALELVVAIPPRVPAGATSFGLYLKNTSVKLLKNVGIVDIKAEGGTFWGANGGVEAIKALCRAIANLRAEG